MGITATIMNTATGHRAQYFGHVPDLRLGAEIMALIGEA